MINAHFTSTFVVLVEAGVTSESNNEQAEKWTSCSSKMADQDIQASKVYGLSLIYGTSITYTIPCTKLPFSNFIYFDLLM